MDVLYGRNGAGKSRVLEGLQNALVPTSERAWDGIFLLHVTEVATGGRVLYREILRSNSATQFEPRLTTRPWHTLDDLKRGLAGWIERHLAYLIHEAGMDDEDEWVAGLTWDLLHPLSLVLRSWDSGDKPVWRAYVGASHGTATPLVRAVLESFDEGRASAEAPARDARLAASISNAWLDIEHCDLRLARHPWAIFPLLSLDVELDPATSMSYAFPLVTEESSSELGRAALKWCHSKTRSPLSGGKPLVSGVNSAGLLVIEPDAVARLDELAARANAIYGGLLVDAPTLTWTLGSVERWLYSTQRPLLWGATDPSGTLVEIDSLSLAQRRWAALAIRLAMLPADMARVTESVLGFPLLMLVDEPEQALHPTAQRFLWDGLSRLAKDKQMQIVLASHSPTFLRGRECRLWHVRRGPRGESQIIGLPAARLKDIVGLGLDPADLIQLTRAFVIVEGRHDELVLDEVLGDELADRSASVLAMRGIKNLSSVLDARFIFDYTDARVLVLVDNVNDHDPSFMWSEAREAAERGDRARAREIMEGLGNDREQGFLREFTIRALERAQEGRVLVKGLKVPDILDLLPVPIIAPGAGERTWDQIRGLPDRPKSGGGTKFKEWLGKRFGADLSDGVIRAAASNLDSVPEDLFDILRLLDDTR